VRKQTDYYARFGEIVYNISSSQFVFSAKLKSNVASSYICQLPQHGQFELSPQPWNQCVVAVKLTTDNAGPSYSGVMV